MKVPENVGAYIIAVVPRFSLDVYLPSCAALNPNCVNCDLFNQLFMFVFSTKHDYTVITHRRKLINQSVFAPHLDGSEWFGKDAMQAKKHTCKKKKAPSLKIFKIIKCLELL